MSEIGDIILKLADWETANKQTKEDQSQRIATLETQLAAMTTKRNEIQVAFDGFRSDAKITRKHLEIELADTKERLTKAEADLAWYKKESTWNPEFGIHEPKRVK